MDFKEIQEILKLVDASSLTEVEIEQEDFKLVIRKKMPESNIIYQQAPAAMQTAPIMPAAPTVMAPPALAQTPTAEPKAEEKAASDAPASQNLYEFKSPMIGTFYRASSPETPPYVKVGDQVRKGQIVCIVEAMKLFNEIECEVEGTIVKILVDDAQPVEYDKPLFLIDLGT